jgi:hypothetical protein
MRKIDRNYSIKRKKLVKTTTLTLLIAAFLVLSSAVTAISMNMKVETTTNGSEETLGTSDIADVQSSYEVHASGQLEEGVEVEFRSKGGVVVWDNDITWYDNIYRSDTSSNYRLADDFLFTANTDVMDVHWLGGNWGGGPGDEADVVIEFYDDNGNQPGSVIAGPYPYAWDAIYKEGPYTPWTVWYNEVDLPEVVSFNAGTKYWIMIAYDGPGYPYWGFAVHSSYQLTNAKQWTGSSWINTYEDGAFQLTTKYDHDVGITEIKHPTHGDMPGCPCIPVEVTLLNQGSNDETVDVNVEIHRDLMKTSFPYDDFNMEWNFEGMGANWQFVNWETWFPYKANPAHGQWMAEFNQHGCTYGFAELITHEPIYLCGDCLDPYLKFYFWHDDYGSDDYMDVWISTSGKYGQYVKVGGPYERLCCPDCPIGWKEYRISLEEFICQPIWIKFIGHCDGTPSAYNLFVDYVGVFDLEYKATQSVQIDAGEEKQVEFECWDATCWWCQYENEELLFWVGAWSELEGDEYPVNDGFGPFEWDFLPVWIYIPWTHDVGDKEIKSPTGHNLAGPLDMIQIIKNYGKEPESCFNVYMAVRPLYLVLKLDETFDCWERDPDHYPSYYYAYRPCGWTEEGGYYSDYGWEDGGGVAWLWWIYARYYAWNRIESPPRNTLGEDKLELVFDSDIRHYSGTFLATVETRADDMDSWTDVSPWPNPVNQDHAGTYTVDISHDMGAGTQVRFGFYGYYYYLDDWFVDNVKLISYTCGEIIWQDKVCIDDIQVCEEKEVVFEQWEPEPPEPCFCGTVWYCIDSWTKMLDPPDQNPANDLKRIFISVEFMHDVAVNKFTSPEFDLFVEEIIKYHDGYDNNAIGLTAPGTWQGAMRLTPTELGPHSGKDLIAVNVYFHETSSIDGTVIIYGEGDPVTPGSMVSSEGFTFSGSGLKRVDLTTTVEIDDHNEIWVAVEWEQLTAPFFPFGVDPGPITPGKGGWVSLDGTSWAELSVYGLSYDWVLEAVVETTGNGCDEIPEPDVYVPCEEVDICVEFENKGTYVEDATISWRFYEYTPAETLIAEDSFNLLMDPLTTYVECLLTYDFTEEGVFKMEVEIQLDPVDKDCDLSNNGPISIIIGADCCGPESCFVLDPEYPDGLNNWYVSAVTVTVDAWETCEVQSGIDHIVYILDGVMDTIAGDHGQFVIDGDGVHHGEIYAVDMVGNEGTHHTFEVAIDEGDPTCDLIYSKYTEDDTQKVEFTVLAGDATSGMNRVEFLIDGVLEDTVDGPGPYVFDIDFSGYDGSTQFCAQAYDNAGNDAEDCESGIAFSKQKSYSQTKTRTLTTEQVILRLGL